MFDHGITEYIIQTLYQIYFFFIFKFCTKVCVLERFIKIGDTIREREGWKIAFERKETGYKHRL